MFTLCTSSHFSDSVTMYYLKGQAQQIGRTTFERYCDCERLPALIAEVGGEPLFYVSKYVAEGVEAPCYAVKMGGEWYVWLDDCTGGRFEWHGGGKRATRQTARA